MITFCCFALLAWGLGAVDLAAHGASTVHQSVEEPFARRTFALIKPDAVARGEMGEILRFIELNGFSIQQMELRQLSPEEAQELYGAHKDRDFFATLVEFMTSAPVVILVLGHKEADTDVVTAWRTCIGATDPGPAKVGTLRYMYGTSVQQNVRCARTIMDGASNAVHGSDSVASAEREIAIIFGPGSSDAIPKRIRIARLS